VHLNLIWTLTPQSLAEADWIHWLLQDFEIVDHVAPGWDLFENNSIYILSGAYSRIPSWFQDGIRRVHGKGIFHLVIGEKLACLLEQFRNWPRQILD
jgi:hypothetical protein